MRGGRETDTRGAEDEQVRPRGSIDGGRQDTGTRGVRPRGPIDGVAQVRVAATGVPAELLAEVDACVEIPQRGLLRSLNVHVSAAIAVWELTRRRGGGEGG